MWSSYKACKCIVREEWAHIGGEKGGNPVKQFQRVAKSTLANLKGWSKVEFADRKKKQEKLINQLRYVKQSRAREVNGDRIRKLKNQINSMLMNEEIHWKQRSRVDQLNEGDRNTKFSHAKALERKRKNKIWEIENAQGQWTENREDVEKEFCEYFQNSFTTSSPSQSQIQDALRGMLRKVTPETNDYLEEPFTTEEIVEALSQICPTKALGPDGLLAAFFQKHQQTVHGGVLGACLHILNEQGNLAALNHTYIALIPKTSKPRKVTEFRSISLCNVIYIIVVKTIANRLKSILSQIISPTQSVFIPSRLITDNVIIDYECLHKIRLSKGKRKRLVALKLDISKAYDRVEWRFLEQTMKNAWFF